MKKAIWGPVTSGTQSLFPTYAELGVGIYQYSVQWQRAAPTRPADPDSLTGIRGIGPSFISKYADDVLEIVATNTVPIPAEKSVPKLKVLSIAPAMAEAMRIAREGSLIPLSELGIDLAGRIRNGNSVHENSRIAP